jgi:hypothetical protein
VPFAAAPTRVAIVVSFVVLAVTTKGSAGNGVAIRIPKIGLILPLDKVQGWRYSPKNLRRCNG